MFDLLPAFDPFVPQLEQLTRAFLQHEDVLRAYLRLRSETSKGYAAGTVGWATVAASLKVKRHQ
jgi:hypothetical protein